MSTHNPICMAEEFWANSYFSVARHYGGVKAFGHEYNIVNKQGATIFELSDPSSKYYVGDGKKKAIEPGEPADLCRVDFIPLYKELGRDSFIKVLEIHPKKSDVELKKIFLELIEQKHGTV